jgi:hypothetical protein
MTNWRIFLDKDLAKRMFDHYRYRLNQLLEKDELKEIASETMKGSLKEEGERLERAWKEVQGLSAPLTKGPYHKELLQAILSQYVKDLKRFRAATSEVQGLILRKLHDDLEQAEEALRS